MIILAIINYILYSLYITFITHRLFLISWIKDEWPTYLEKKQVNVLLKKKLNCHVKLNILHVWHTWMLKQILMIFKCDLIAWEKKIRC